MQEVLALARCAGIIPESWVADQRAPEPIAPLAFDDAEDFVGNVVAWASDFRLDAQRGQPVYVEVLCEAGRPATATRSRCWRLRRVAPTVAHPEQIAA